MSTRRLNPVVWSEGMFLRPQHLQHFDQFAEERLHYHVDRLSPFQWGVRRLVINEDALSDHRIEIQELDAVLPGGTVLRYPGNAVIETREFDAGAERVSVHLGLRRVSETEASTAAEGSGSRQVRFFQRSETLPDVVRGDRPAPIDLAYANLRLFLDDEERELEVHESFKLCEVIATGELKQPFGLDPAYCPPLLSIQAHQPLADQLAKLVAQIASRVRVVAGRTVTTATADLPKMWMRYTLARMTPVLRHLLSTGETRPFDLYTTLVETGAALAAFQLDEPAELPTYEHAALGQCFSELIAFVESHLEEAVPDRFQERILEYDEAGKLYLTKDLNTDLVDPRNLYFIGVKANLEAEELIKRVVTEGKAGSRGSARVAVMTMTEGLKLEHLSAAPTEIATRPDFHYFRVDPHSPKWSKVKDDFSFALAIPMVESADVRFYVVNLGAES